MATPHWRCRLRGAGIQLTLAGQPLCSAPSASMHQEPHVPLRSQRPRRPRHRRQRRHRPRHGPRPGRSRRSIAVAGRNAEKSEAAAASSPSSASRPPSLDVDVTDEAAMPRRWSTRPSTRLGRIDILFNNAGINIRKPPHELSLDEWHKVIDVNLTSAFSASQAVYPAHEAGRRRQDHQHRHHDVDLRRRASRRPTAPARAASSSSPRRWPWPGPRTTSRSTRSCRAGSTPS